MHRSGSCLPLANGQLAPTSLVVQMTSWISSGQAARADDGGETRKETSSRVKVNVTCAPRGEAGSAGVLVLVLVSEGPSLLHPNVRPMTTRSLLKPNDLVAMETGHLGLNSHLATSCPSTHTNSKC